LIFSQDSIAISNTLNIPINIAASIKDIHAYWLIDENNDGVADQVDYHNDFKIDTILNWEKINNRFLVQLEIYNPNYTNEIQNSFEKYLYSYPKLTQTIKIRRQSLLANINKIDNEIKIIDSLKMYEYFTLPNEILKIQESRANHEQNTVSLDNLLFKSSPDSQTEIIPTPKLLHDVVLPLYTQNIKNKAELNTITEPFIFIDNFKEVHCPVDINEEKHTSAKFSIISLLLGILVSAFIDFKRKIFDFVNKK
jgi:hypothetical protein